MGTAVVRLDWNISIAGAPNECASECAKGCVRTIVVIVPVGDMCNYERGSLLVCLQGCSLGLAVIIVGFGGGGIVGCKWVMEEGSEVRPRD